MNGVKDSHHCDEHTRYCTEKKREDIDTRGSMSGMFNGNLAHAERLLFGPLVGCLPSARHCSQVCGFLKSNLPFDEFGRNCVRGKLRAHAWHVIGLAAASMEFCWFLAK